MSICCIEACGRRAKARGYCTLHYQRWRATGTPTDTLIAPRGTSLSVRLDRFLIPTSNGCIEWSGSRRGRGYGRIQVDGRGRGTHVVAWELVHGPVPHGLFVCHRCDNPPCCNTDHLFLGTPADNHADMVAKGRSNAPSGERHGMTRLTTEQVIHVRSLVGQGHSYPTLAQRFGVSRSTIWRAARHLTKHTTQGATR